MAFDINDPDVKEAMKRGLIAPNADSIIDESAADDDIPKDSDVKEALKRGIMTLDEAKELYTDFKKETPGLVVKADGEEGTAKDYGEVSRKEMGVWDRIVSIPAKPFVRGIAEDIKKQQKMTLGNQVQQFFNEQIYMASQYASGLTFGVYEPELDAPTEKAAIAGTLLNIAGMGITATLGGAALRAIPGVGGVVKSLETGAKTATGWAKHAKAIGAMSIEATAIGGVSGTARGLIRGEPFEDALADGAIDAGLFVGVGVGFYGVGQGISKVFKAKARYRGGKQTTVQAEVLGEELLKNKSLDGKLKFLAKAKAEGRLNPRQERVYDGLRKIKVSQPVAGPLPEAELVKDKGLLVDLIGDDAENLVKAQLTGPNAPMKAIYESTPSLQSMVKKGEFIEVMMSAQGFFRDQLKQPNTIADLLASPFMNNANSLGVLLADKMARKLPSRYSKLGRNAFIDFVEKPTKQGLKALREIIPGKELTKTLGASPQTFLRKGKTIFTDIRISAKEADAMFGDILNNNFQALSKASEGMISFKDLGLAADVNALAKSSITLNKGMSRTFIQAFSRDVDTAPFVRANPKLQKAIYAERNIRATTMELGDEVAKKSEIVQRISELKGTTGNIPGDEAANLIGRELEELGLKLKSSTGRLGMLQREINAGKVELSQLGKGVREQVMNFVNETYAPTAINQSAIKALEVLRQSGYKENVNYIKASSELADYMNALIVAGKDFDIPARLGKKFSFGFFNNLSRKFQNQFGFNSPFEGLLQEMRYRDVAIRGRKKVYIDKLKKIGIKEGDKHSKDFFDFCENTISQSSDDFLKLSPDMQRKFVNGRKEIRGMYDELIDEMNAVLKSQNMTLVNKRPDYITHFREVQEGLPGFLDDMMNPGPLSKAELIAGGKTVAEADAIVSAYPKSLQTKMYSVRKASHQPDPSRTFMSADFHRTGKEYTPDAIEAMKRYIQPALDRIHYTDIVRQLEVARAFAPQNMGNLLSSIKNDYLLKLPSGLERETSSALKATARGLQARMAKGFLFGPPNVALQQLLSMGMSFSIGSRDALVSFTKMYSKEGKRMWSKSVNKATRSVVEGVDLDAKLFRGLFKGLNKYKITRSLKTAKNYWENWTSFLLRHWDSVAANHGFQTAIENARRIGITNEKALIRIGDKWADMIQGSFAAIDRPKILTDTLGRAFMQFQSFSVNLGATLMNDLPNIGLTEGMHKPIIQLLRGYAAMSIVNEASRAAGIPAPMDYSTVIPLGNSARFGGIPGAMGSIFQTTVQLAGGKRERGLAWKRAKQMGAALTIAGGAQMARMWDVYTMDRKQRKSMGKRTKTGVKTKTMAYIFGASSQRRIKRELEENKKGFLGKQRRRTRKDIKKTVKGFFK